MRNLFCSCFVALFLLLFKVQAADKVSMPLELRAYQATALLYRQTYDGGFEMHCTATAFEKVTGGYLFVTAAHCTAKDDVSHERVEIEKARFYITYDETGDKKFLPATVKMAGYQHNGDDFSILEVKTDQNLIVMPLGDETLESVGSAVINCASPQGLGKQLFHGWLSSLRVDRPVQEGDINWSDAMFLQIELGPGSSGSSVISVNQRAIIAFIVGHIEQNAVAVPVSRFIKFRAAVIAGKYKWFLAEK